MRPVVHQYPPFNLRIFPPGQFENLGHFTGFIQDDNNLDSRGREKTLIAMDGPPKVLIFLIERKNYT
jgi:hypothetical protein